MHTTSRFAVVGAVFFLSAVAAGPGSAQSTSVELTYDLAHLSVRDWGGMSGLSGSVTFGTPVPGLVGRLGYRRLDTDGGILLVDCDFSTCTDGPFSRSYVLEALATGFGGTVWSGGALELTLWADLALVRQSTELTHQDSGEKSTSDTVTDFGVGPSATLRFARGFLGLEPILRVGYQRIFKGECLADASCHQPRNLTSVGIGLSWGG